MADTWECVVCGKPHAGVPAEEANNGPVCHLCHTDSKKLTARLRSKHKKRKKRR